MHVPADPCCVAVRSPGQTCHRLGVCWHAPTRSSSPASPATACRLRREPDAVSEATCNTPHTVTPPPQPGHVILLLELDGGPHMRGELHFRNAFNACRQLIVALVEVYWPCVAARVCHCRGGVCRHRRDGRHDVARDIRSVLRRVHPRLGPAPLVMRRGTRRSMHCGRGSQRMDMRPP